MNTRKTVLIFFFIIIFPLLTAGQIDSTSCISKFDTAQQRVIYTQVDNMPLFPGGNDSLWSYITKKIEFPHHLTKSISIIVTFTIELDGLSSNHKVIYKNGEYEPAENEALRVLKNMPKWFAGSCKGKKVPVQIVIPINFKAVD